MRLPIAVITAAAVLLWLPSARAAESGWPQSIDIVTASPGGTYYVYGQAPADILSGALGIEVTAQATQGSTRNIILVETGHAALGVITMGIGWEAWTGAGEWTKGQQFRAIRAILPMYDSPFQIAVAKRLGVASFEQLAGKRIGAGGRGGTSGTYFPRIFEMLKIPAVVSLRLNRRDDVAHRGGASSTEWYWQPVFRFRPFLSSIKRRVWNTCRLPRTISKF